MHRTARGLQAGVSRVELAIAGAALAATAGILTHFAISSQRASGYTRRLHLVAGINREVHAGIHKDLHAAVAMMTNDRVGRALEDILDLSGGPTPIDSSILPTRDPDGIFERETRPGEKTGNALLFARHAWSADYGCRSGKEYRIDVFRLVYYYLAKQEPGPRSGPGIGLDLSRFASEPIADAATVEGIADPADRSEVLLHLVNQTPGPAGRPRERVGIVWDPSSPRVDLRRIDARTGRLREQPAGRRPWMIRRADHLSSNGLLGSADLSVVSSFSPADDRVARFGVMDPSGDGFPHGFEVQTVGPDFAADVMLRLVIASDSAGLRAKSDMRSSVSLREFRSRRAR